MKLLIGFCLICLPLKHLKVNSGFGNRVHPLTGKRAIHYGIDLKARRDTVYAVLGGMVSSIAYSDGLGIAVRLRHGSIESLYGHLSKILVGPKDSVAAGDPIAITGATGRVTGEHLHFGISYRSRFVDPLQFLYALLIKKDNEQNFQSTPRSAFGQADRGNQSRGIPVSETN